MSEARGSSSWQDDLMSLVEDTGLRYADDGVGISTPALGTKRSDFAAGDSPEGEAESESFKDQVKEFAKAWGEMAVELGKGVKDIVQQNFLTEDCYVVKKLRGPVGKVSGRLSFLNEYLPEDRDPLHSWSVIALVFFLAFAVLIVNREHDSSISLVKKVFIHPPNATLIQLPDGRQLAYLEHGVTSDRAGYSLIAPHNFLSSRLAGIPGVKESLLEEFGVRMVTYDLPGFGESDADPKRNLNSSALDMLHLADAVGISDKFWVLGFSSGAIHAWAALKYIPDRIAGAAMFSPMVNPYESSMTKEEMSRTWEKWVRRRRLMYFFGRRFPRFLTYFYRRSFLSGEHGQIDKWLSLSLGKKDKALVEGPRFEEFWQRDVEESIRQLSPKPFIEEAMLLVQDWGFKLADLQVQKKCPGQGFFSWFNFFSSPGECELTGFQGPIHIWQGMDDEVVPPSVTDYVSRVLPSATVHKLEGEGHFSYLFLCEECHRQILYTLFGTPQGPLEQTNQLQPEASTEEEDEETLSDAMEEAAVPVSVVV